MNKLLLIPFLIIALLTGSVPAQRAKPRPLKSPAVAKKVAAKGVGAKGVAILPQTSAAPAYEIPVTVKTLANGMQVIVLPDRSVPLVTVSLAVRNGSFTEPPELNGLSHLYEHMFFKTNHAAALFRCQRMEFSNAQLYQASGCDREMALKSQIGDVNYQGELEETGSASNASTQQEVVEYFTSTTSP